MGASEPDYVRPVFPGPSGPAVAHYSEQTAGGGDHVVTSQPYGSQQALDHPHYHQWEDEVCLKCDIEGPRSWEAGRPPVPSVKVQDYTITPPYHPATMPRPWRPTGRQLPQAPGPRPHQASGPRPHQAPEPRLHQAPGPRPHQAAGRYGRPVSEYGPPRLCNPR